MGKEQPSSFYDQMYLDTQEYSKPYDQSRYLKVWQTMSSHLDKDIAVIDLGCGVGQAAEMLHDQEFLMYLGVDFSAKAILKAREKNITGDFAFLCSDLFSFIETSPELGEVQWFCSETLEHIEQDLDLLKKIQKRGSGYKIAVSVPTFDDPGHVRYFKTPMEASVRYSKYINISEVQKIGAWIVLTGTVK